jgi:uncharacterized protein YodC (DUF2158 family)
MKIEAGDVVRLKSGSPDMTVTKSDEQNSTCSWFENGQVRREVFPTVTLMKDHPTSPASSVNPKK